MYRNFLGGVLSIILFSVAHAQTISTSTDQSKRKGVHYRFPDFLPADIYRHDGTNSQGTLNYNLLTEEIIIELGNTKVAYDPIDPVQKIVIDSIEFIPIQGIIYEVLANGDVKLLVHRKQIMVRKGQQTGLGRTSSTYSSNTNTYSLEPDELPSIKDKATLYQLILPGEFGLKDINTYYSNSADQVKLLRKFKQLESLFPEKAKEIKALVKKEKLKFSKEKDLVRLMNFCYENH